MFGAFQKQKGGLCGQWGCIEQGVEDVGGTGGQV